MATFLPGVTDNALRTPTLDLDYSFLQANQQKKDTQYIQGLSEVSAGYNAILNAKVTDYANIQKKQEYAKVAEDGLKKLSRADLSLPANVAQAETLYSPFWQDDILLQDIGYTKYADNELRKLDSWKMSKDKDVHSMYSDYAVRYIQQGLQKLQGAGRDRNNYRKLDKREAVPFYDIDADVDSAWQKEVGTGKGIETVISDGHGALITQYNGIKSKDAYRTYYLSKIGNKYDKQLKVIASVKAQDARDNISRMLPGVDEDTINSKFAEGVLGELGTSYKKVADSYNDQATYWAAKKKDIIDQVKQKQKGVIYQEQEGNLAYYDQMMKQYNNAGAQYSQEYWNRYSPVTVDGKVNEGYNKSLESIKLDPESYIQNVEKIAMAENWASGRASVSSEKKELDPVWNAYREQRNKDIEHQLTRRSQDITSRGQTLDWMQRTGTDLQGNQLPGFDPDRASGWYGKIDNGDGSGVYGGGYNPATGDITGYHTVEPAKLPGGIDAIQQSLNQRANNVAAQIFNPDPDGISGIALSSLGFTREQIIDFSEAAKTMSDGTRLTNTKQIDAWNKVKDALTQHGVKYPILGPAAMQSALIEYSGNVAQQLMNGDKQEDVEKGNRLLAGYITAQTQRDIYLKSKQNLDNAIKNKILTDKDNKYDKLIVKDPHGGKRVITVNDMIQDFPELDLVGASDNTPLHLTSRDVAELYDKGEFNYGGEGNVTINGKSYRFRDLGILGMQEGLNNEYKFNKHFHDTILPKYGYSKKFNELRKEASATALDGMKEYKNGVIYKEIGYDPNASKKGNKGQEQFALRLAPELANPSNTQLFYNGSTGEPIGEKDEQVIRSMLTNVKDVQENVGSIVRTRNDKDEKVFAIHFQSANSNSNVTAEGEKLNKFAGKTVMLRVSPNAQGLTINSIPDNQGSYIYGDIYNGATYSSNELLKNMGITYQVKGYDYGADGRATKASVVITQRVKDPDHIGQYIDKPTVDVTIPLIGSAGKNADQVMNAVIGTVVAHGNENVYNNNQAHNKNPEQGKNIDQVLKELQ